MADLPKTLRDIQRAADEGMLAAIDRAERTGSRVEVMLHRLALWTDLASRYVDELPHNDFFSDWLTGIGFAARTLASAAPPKRDLITTKGVLALAAQVQRIVAQAERAARREAQS